MLTPMFLIGFPLLGVPKLTVSTPTVAGVGTRDPGEHRRPVKPRQAGPVDRAPRLTSAEPWLSAGSA
jgi:hypothetical protein